MKEFVVGVLVLSILIGLVFLLDKFIDLQTVLLIILGASGVALVIIICIGFGAILLTLWEDIVSWWRNG